MSQPQWRVFRLNFYDPNGNLMNVKLSASRSLEQITDYYNQSVGMGLSTMPTIEEIVEIHYLAHLDDIVADGEVIV